MNFKDTLRRLRKDKGLTGEQLGDLFGVAKTTISAWERGVNFPKADMIRKIADFFNVSVDYLMGNPEPREDSSNKQYIDVSGLSEEDIVAISLIVERLKEKNNG